MASTKFAIKAVWLSYDFGLRADYESLFTWLDNHKAKDCGNGLAYFQYMIPTEKLEKSLFLNHLREDIKKSIKLSSNDRLYAVWRDSESKMVIGEFLFGSRKQPIWTGYGNKGGEETFDSEE